MLTENLTENMSSNPLDAAVSKNQDITELAQEAILTACAAETDAMNQYKQILQLVEDSEEWLGEIAKATLEDIISEEKKHFAQLSTIVSKLPAFVEEFEAGKEEVETEKDTTTETEETTEADTEEVDDVKTEACIQEGGLANTIEQLKDLAAKIGAEPVEITPATSEEDTEKVEDEDVEESVADKVTDEENGEVLYFDGDKVIKIIAEELSADIDELNQIANDNDFYEDKVSDTDIDKFLAVLELTEDELNPIEDRIVKDAIWTRDEDEAREKEIEAQEDFKHDISELEALLDTDDLQSIRLYSNKAKDALRDLIYDLKNA